MSSPSQPPIAEDDLEVTSSAPAHHSGRRLRRRTAQVSAPPGQPPEVTRTELLEADPLPPIKNAKRRLLWASPIIVVFAVLGFAGGREGWSLAWFGLSIWLVYAGVLWYDHRALLQAKGRTLVVRNRFRTREVDATEVVGVRHQFNGKTPDFSLDLADGSSVWVPTSRLERGHATLFAWLGWFAPQATLDRKSRYYRDHLSAEKLI